MIVTRAHENSKCDNCEKDAEIEIVFSRVNSVMLCSNCKYNMKEIIMKTVYRKGDIVTYIERDRKVYDNMFTYDRRYYVIDIKDEGELIALLTDEGREVFVSGRCFELCRRKYR